MIPEQTVSIDEICDKLAKRQKEGRLHSIVLVAEGYGGNFRTNRDINESPAYGIARRIAELTGQETRLLFLAICREAVLLL